MWSYTRFFGLISFVFRMFTRSILMSSAPLYRPLLHAPRWPMFAIIQADALGLANLVSPAMQLIFGEFFVVKCMGRVPVKIEDQSLPWYFPLIVPSCVMGPSLICRSIPSYSPFIDSTCYVQRSLLRINLASDWNGNASDSFPYFLHCF